MRQSILARKYSQAIVALAQKKADIDNVYTEMMDITDLLQKLHCYDLLICKKASVHDKMAAWTPVEQVMRKYFSDFVLSIVAFVIKKKVLHLFSRILNNINEIIYEMQSRLEIEVSLANSTVETMFLDSKNADQSLVNIDEKAINNETISTNKFSSAIKQKISSELQSLSDMHLEILFKYDPSIIGGMKLRIKNKIIDYSVHGKLVSWLKSSGVNI